MKILHVLRGPALSLACIGLLLPHAAFGAPPVAVSPAAEGQPSVGPAPAVADVALHAGGMLLGQVVDQQGLPVANTARAGEPMLRHPPQPPNAQGPALKPGQRSIRQAHAGSPEMAACVTPFG